jgi:hypothetical protein
VHTLAASTSHSCTHTLTLAHCAPRHISDSLALLWRTTKLDHSPTTSVGNVAIKSIARRCERQAAPHYCAQRPCFALHWSSVMLSAQPVNLLGAAVIFSWGPVPVQHTRLPFLLLPSSHRHHHTPLLSLHCSCRRCAGCSTRSRRGVDRLFVCGRRADGHVCRHPPGC